MMAMIAQTLSAPDRIAPDHREIRSREVGLEAIIVVMSNAAHRDEVEEDSIADWSP